MVLPQSFPNLQPLPVHPPPITTLQHPSLGLPSSRSPPPPFCFLVHCKCFSTLARLPHVCTCFLLSRESGFLCPLPIAPCCFHGWCLQTTGQLSPNWHQGTQTQMQVRCTYVTTIMPMSLCLGKHQKGAESAHCLQSHLFHQQGRHSCAPFPPAAAPATGVAKGGKMHRPWCNMCPTPMLQMVKFRASHGCTCTEDGCVDIALHCSEWDGIAGVRIATQ